jgi:hypothetical protein
MPRSIKFNRVVVAGIAAAAISPTAALASPAIDGGVPAPGSSVVQDMRAPDQVAGSTVDRQAPAGMPTWPTSPQPIPHRVVTTASTPVADGDGIDGGVLIALGGGALLAVGGLGLVGRKRLQVVRQRQLA